MENWVDLINYEGRYQISSLGRIRSIPRTVKMQNRTRSVRSVFISEYHNNNGYTQVQLYNENGRKSFLLHRLVATHFIPNPNNLPEVNHKFGDKNDNSVSGLEWSTVSNNRQHAYDIGLNPGRGKKIV